MAVSPSSHFTGPIFSATNRCAPSPAWSTRSRLVTRCSLTPSTRCIGLDRRGQSYILLLGTGNGCCWWTIAGLTPPDVDVRFYDDKGWRRFRSDEPTILRGHERRELHREMCINIAP